MGLSVCERCCNRSGRCDPMVSPVPRRLGYRVRWHDQPSAIAG
ncbi:hypothetical protein [Lysobacter gummosus]